MSGQGLISREYSSSNTSSNECYEKYLNIFSVSNHKITYLI